jgi:hypothetical protein
MPSERSPKQILYYRPMRRHEESEEEDGFMLEDGMG